MAEPDQAKPEDPIRWPDQAGLDPSIPPLIPRAAPKKITGDADWNALDPGTEFEGPDGKHYVKPWIVNNDQDFDKVPEGHDFVGPDRQKHVKQRFEPLDVTTQTLYDMATNDREREKALHRALPTSSISALVTEQAGAAGVKKDSKGEFYVQMPDGRLLKPGRGWQAAAGTLLSSAPAIGGTLGAIAGGTAGSAVPGAGTAAGALGGAAGGAILGKGFNDMTLALAGIYDRSIGEETVGLATEGAWSAGGEAVGGTVAAAWPAIKYGLKAGKEMGPSTLAWILGATETPEATRQALRLAQAGAKPRPSRWATEAPLPARVVEQFDPVFRGWNPLDRANLAYYEREAGQLLDRPEIDVPPSVRPSLTRAEFPVDVSPAGEAMFSRVQADLAAKDAAAVTARDSAIATAQTTAVGRETELESRLSILGAAEKDARESAEQAIQAGFSDIDQENQRILGAVRAGRHPGDLWTRNHERLDALHTGFMARAEHMYTNQVDQVAGNTPLVTETMRREFEQMMESLPLEFQQAYPTMMREFERWRSREPMTLQWARNLRNYARASTDRAQLHADVFEGAKRKVAGALNRMIHDPAQPPMVRHAVRNLDTIDGWYDRTSSVFRQKAVEALTDRELARFPADRSKLAELIFDQGSSADRAMIRNRLGTDLWNATMTADVDRVIESSRDLLGEIDANRFARQVTERLQELSGPGSAKWRAQDVPPRTRQLALQVQALQGHIPLERLPGDNVQTLLQRALDHSAEAKALAKERPLETLADEIKLAQQRHTAEITQARRDEPMRALADPEASHKLIEVTNHILDNPDQIITAAQRFGFDSNEFKTLRRVAVHRLLQREDPGSLLREVTGARGRGGMPEHVQQLLFPGTTREDLLTIAHDAEFLMRSGRTGEMGTSLAAGGRVLSPTTDADLPLAWMRHVPGGKFLARMTLGKFYAFVTDKVMTNPKFIAYVARGLDSGTPQGRLAARQAVQNAIQTGRFVGAATGTTLPEVIDREQTPQRPPRPSPGWRQMPPRPVAPRRNQVRGDISPLVSPNYGLTVG